MINAGRASLADLQTIYSLEDVYVLLETVIVEAENERRQQEVAARD